MFLNGATIAFVLLLAAALLFTLIIRRQLSHFSQTIAYGVLLLIAIAVALHLYSQANFVGPIRAYFDVSGSEFNSYTTLTSLLLCLGATISAIAALFVTPHKWWHIL